jgi:hypothetical protein
VAGDQGAPRRAVRARRGGRPRRLRRRRRAATDANFGRVLAAYGGIFIVGSLLWGVVFDGFTPDRYDIAGAAVCLVGVTVIMYAPR